MEFSDRGIPILEVTEKVNALLYCLTADGGHNEDALGHLMDLAAHVKEKLSAPVDLAAEAWSPDAVRELQENYGASPEPVIVLPYERPEERAADIQNKTDGLKYCLQHNLNAQAMEVIMDLMAFVHEESAADLNLSFPEWGADAVEELHGVYGIEPTPIKMAS